MNGSLQFPLPLLAFEKCHQDRLEAVGIYAVIETGKLRMQKLSVKEQENELASCKMLTLDSKNTEPHIRAIELGCIFCRYPLPASLDLIPAWIKIHATCEKFLEAWKSRGLTVSLTRVPKDLLIEARNGSINKYKRFAALCAVKAIIGNKKMAVVTSARVRAGMLGYPSARTLFDENGLVTKSGQTFLDLREDQCSPPTRSQVRTLLNKLVRSSIVRRFSTGKGRMTYYSHRLSSEDIAEAVLSKAKAFEPSEREKNIKRELRFLSPIKCRAWKNLGKKQPHNGNITSSGGGNKPSDAPKTDPTHRHLIATSSPHNAPSYASHDANHYATLNATPVLGCSEVIVIKSENRPEPCLPAFTPPILEEVMSHSMSLFPKESGVEDFGRRWFEEQGNDPRWHKSDWKRGCSRFVADQVQRAKLAARYESIDEMEFVEKTTSEGCAKTEN